MPSLDSGSSTHIMQKEKQPRTIFWIWSFYPTLAGAADLLVCLPMGQALSPALPSQLPSTTNPCFADSTVVGTLVVLLWCLLLPRGHVQYFAKVVWDDNEVGFLTSLAFQLLSTILFSHSPMLSCLIGSMVLYIFFILEILYVYFYVQKLDVLLDSASSIVKGLLHMLQN